MGEMRKTPQDERGTQVAPPPRARVLSWRDVMRKVTEDIKSGKPPSDFPAGVSIRTDFAGAMAILKIGKKVRREAWLPDDHLLLDSHGVVMWGGQYSRPYVLAMKSYDATDWVVYYGDPS